MLISHTVKSREGSTCYAGNASRDPQFIASNQIFYSLDQLKREVPDRTRDNLILWDDRSNKNKCCGKVISGSVNKQTARVKRKRNKTSIGSGII